MEKTLDLKKVNQKRTEQKSPLSWKAAERKKGERKWQIGSIIVLILFFIFVLWKKNYFGMMLALIMGFLLFSARLKKETYFEISKKGVIRNREIFPWHSLKSFCIFDNPPEIYFESKKSKLFYHVIFPIPRDLIEKARKIMSNFLPEKDIEKKIIDVLGSKLGL